MGVWWAALVGHGWFLAGGRRGWAAVTPAAVVALAVTVPVLLVAGLLRFDASAVGHRVDVAREKGDCGRVVSAQDWGLVRPAAGRRAPDRPRRPVRGRVPPAGDRAGAADPGAGRRHQGAGGGLRHARRRRGRTGHADVADTVLNGFLGGLPVKDPCRTVTVTDWLRDRRPSHDTLDRSASAVARTAPAWSRVRRPLHVGQELAGGARPLPAADRPVPRRRADPAGPHRGRHATLGIELAHVRGLLDGPTDIQPEYCDKPAKYVYKPPRPSARAASTGRCSTATTPTAGSCRAVGAPPTRRTRSWWCARTPRPTGRRWRPARTRTRRSRSSRTR